MSAATPLPTDDPIIRDETHTLDGTEYRFVVTRGASVAGTPLYCCWVRRTDRTYRPDQREFSVYVAGGGFEAVIGAFRHILAGGSEE